MGLYKLIATHLAAPGKVRKTYIRAAGAPQQATIYRCGSCDWGSDYKQADIERCPRCGAALVEGER